MNFHHRLGNSPGKQVTRLEFWLLIAVVVLAWSYLAVRAAIVPLMQDEANSFWMYVHAGKFLPFRSHPDAGNHFLNTFFGLIGFKLFGFSTIGIRWGSLLFYPLYAWGCWSLTSRFNLLLHWSSFLSLALCPFLFDFFALFRGYGIAMAFWIWALAGFMAFVQKGSARYLLMMTISASAGLSANLSLLPECGILFGISFLVFVLDRRPSALNARGIKALSLIAYCAVLSFAALIALDLSHKGLLYLGSSKGLMFAPVGTLISAIFSGPGSLLANQLVVVPAFIGLVVAIWNVIRGGQWRSQLSLLVAVLFLGALARVMMFHLLGTNYPYDRAVLQWVPLYILIFACTIDHLSLHNPAWSWSALLLFVFPIRTVLTLNFNQSASNYEKTMPTRFLNDVATLRRNLGRPIILSGSEHYPPCWAFHQVAMGMVPIEMHSDMSKDDPDDARVITRDQLMQYQAGYHIADSSKSGVLLLVRNVPITWSLVTDTVMAPVDTEEGWIHLPLNCPEGPGGICVVFNALITTADPFSDIMLVSEVVDSSGAYVRYDAAELRHWPLLTKGASIEIARFIPAIPHGGNCSLYLWNNTRTRYSISGMQIRTMRFQQ